VEITEYHHHRRRRRRHFFFFFFPRHLANKRPISVSQLCQSINLFNVLPGFELNI